MPTPRKYATAAARQAAYRQRLRQPPSDGRPLMPLRAVPGCPGAPRWRRMMVDAIRLVREVEEEMAVVYDERTERWQDSERGQAFSEQLEALGEALTTLEDWATEVPG